MRKRQGRRNQDIVEVEELRMQQLDQTRKLLEEDEINR